mmetsp:Transcript_10100/g.15962  ORF Transcript_10100/g.15962 Transcript_10100/m.15962 type:complete len:220 (-) Transcript_10100:1180-1839(-)
MIFPGLGLAFCMHLNIKWECPCILVSSAVNSGWSRCNSSVDSSLDCFDSTVSNHCGHAGIDFFVEVHVFVSVSDFNEFCVDLRIIWIGRRNLGDNSNEVDNIVCGIAESGDKQLVPEWGAVCGIVDQCNGHVLAKSKIFLHFVELLLAGLRSLQEATVSTQHFFPSVSSDIEEVVRSEHNRVVLETWIGDYKGMLRLLNAPHQIEVLGIEVRCVLAACF